MQHVAGEASTARCLVIESTGLVGFRQRAAGARHIVTNSLIEDAASYLEPQLECTGLSRRGISRSTGADTAVWRIGQTDEPEATLLMGATAESLRQIVDRLRGFGNIDTRRTPTVLPGWTPGVLSTRATDLGERQTRAACTTTSAARAPQALALTRIQTGISRLACPRCHATGQQAAHPCAAIHGVYFVSALLYSLGSSRRTRRQDQIRTVW